MSNIKEIKKPINKGAIDVLKETVALVEKGDVVDLSIAWVTKDGGIGGIKSGGDNQILMWASLEHSTKQFYKDYVEE